MNTNFIRYLEAKVEIDDRALDDGVRAALCAAVASGAVDGVEPDGAGLDALEVGAGVGTMIDRLERWGVLAGPVRYTAIDVDPCNIAEARRRLQARGFEAQSGDSMRRGRMEVELHTVDLYDFMARETRRFDLLIAHAFLDLFNLSTVLPPLLSLLRPGGLFYSSLNFDGETRFSPLVDADLDRRIEAAYHRTMDERVRDGRPSGDSCCGRHLVQHLREAGLEMVRSGPSDWSVWARSEDEKCFLHFIIDTVAESLRDFEDDRFPAWVALRHAQVEGGELHLRARHLDVLARVPL